MNKTFICSVCNQEKPTQASGGTGYGYDKNDNKICYVCCGQIDKEEMQKTGRATLYLTQENGQNKVTNWPGTLVFKPYYSKTGRHNIAGRRYDVWFTFDGKPWRGTTYGDNTQICHCRRIKS